ncbi:MAG: hypothetical protein ACJA0G_002209 [Kangiellaceae bacterium]|jgi:uncharacterized protein YejL (UPF0352 family)
MPIQSRYSNKEFDALTQEVFLALEKHKAKGDLSIMVLGNVLASIFQHQVNQDVRKVMINQFCDALKKSTNSAAS